uniref:Uncharacterized protein n=1 Tax=Knipowitschia caucasica TaxID=637954 RepID=A0AAV2LJI1_KNICA
MWRSSSHFARTLLAALDYNHHNNRPAHVNSKGQVSLGDFFCESSSLFLYPFLVLVLEVDFQSHWLSP